MSTEFTLSFSSSHQGDVSFRGKHSGQLDFASPITDKDRADICWYVETYGAQSLARAPTLVILDNLETVAASVARRAPAGSPNSPRETKATTESENALQELLTAASKWSQAGGSRVLLTSRIPQFGHPDYAIAGTFKHRRIVLEGLGSAAYPDDALEWFAKLNLLPTAEPPQVPPPKRDDLIRLFDRVRFHPLSICVLVQQLKTRTAKQLEERLEQLLAEDAVSLVADEGTPKSLIASLQLSLERLSEEERHAVRRLGVFQGGAMEDSLLAITQLGESGSWPKLRRQLETAALIESETHPGIVFPFLRFHPTLAPVPWAGLDEQEKVLLNMAHREHFAAVAQRFHLDDEKHPSEARIIARRELPNLLYAIYQSPLEADDLKAVTFATYVAACLHTLGMTREADLVIKRAEKASGKSGSDAWIMLQSSRGEQLLKQGRTDDAASIFSEIAQTLSDKPSLTLAMMLGYLGRCYRDGNRPDLAVGSLRQGIAVTKKLEQNDALQRQRGSLLVDLADVLTVQGNFDGARDHYARGRDIFKELDDLRSQGLVLFRCGTLARKEGNLAEAVRLHVDAVAFFQGIDEPAMTALAQIHLGNSLQAVERWEEAEQHYREAASLSEKCDQRALAAAAWGNLAVVTANLGRLELAETWYRKAIHGMQDPPIGDRRATFLSNLAGVVRDQPGRLAEARQLAEQSLAIKVGHDPGTSEIWNTYEILAQIADQQSEHEQAAEYRRLARDAKRNFAGTAYELKRSAPLIASVVNAVGGNEDEKAGVNQLLEQLKESGGEGAALARVVQRILSGERDADELCNGLSQSAILVETILQALEDPAILEALLPDDGPSE